MLAFVLIALKGCDEKEALEDLKTLENINKAHVLFGEWDLMLEVEVSSPEELGTFVMEKIRFRPDVKLTSSLIVAK